MSADSRSVLRPLRGVTGEHADLRDAFESLAKPVFFPRGAILFRQNDSSSGVHLLTRGRARVFLTSDSGSKIVLRTVGPGYLLGLPATIMGTPHLFTAETTEDSEITFLPATDVLEYLRLRGDLCFDIVQMLGAELLHLPPAVHRPATRRRRSD